MRKCLMSFLRFLTRRKALRVPSFFPSFLPIYPAQQSCAGPCARLARSLRGITIVFAARDYYQCCCYCHNKHLLIRPLRKAFVKYCVSTTPTTATANFTGINAANQDDDAAATTPPSPSPLLLRLKEQKKQGGLPERVRTNPETLRQTCAQRVKTLAPTLAPCARTHPASLRRPCAKKKLGKPLRH